MLVWWGGYMRGIVYAFEAKLNKFLKFYAMSILKIEMWGKGGAALLLVYLSNRLQNRAGLQIPICSPAVFSVFNQSLTEAIMLQPAGR